jgi:hypothetical protein
MKIFIVGSTVYQARMQEHAFKLMAQGHEPAVPIFDSQKETVLDILTHNRELMEWADEVHLIYDGRSYGSIFDFGMCFALRKPLRVIYISPKNIVGGMREYAESCEESKDDS